MLYRAPILILAFNRPDLFYATLSRLIKYGFSDVWVSVDGPRPMNTQDSLAISEIYNICINFQIPSECKRFVPVNQGCRNGVLAGITWFFKHNQSGIIIEDDVEIDINYLYKMSSLLRQHTDDRHIFSVSSHSEISQLDTSYAPTDFVLSPMCRVWGWATWSDRWQKHLSLLSKFKEVSIRHIYYSIPKPYRSQTTANLISLCSSRTIDTWDYEWNFSHILSSAYSITPCANFCLNHGFRADATHTVAEHQVPWSEYNRYPMHSVCGGQGSPPSYPSILENKLITNSICNECGFPLVANYILEDLKFLKHLCSRFFNQLRRTT